MHYNSAVWNPEAEDGVELVFLIHRVGLAHAVRVNILRWWSL